MIKIIQLNIILLLLCTTLGMPLFGNEDDDSKKRIVRKASMEECIKIAKQNHPNIKVSIEQMKKAHADYRYSLAPSNIAC